MTLRPRPASEAASPRALPSYSCGTRGEAAVNGAKVPLRPISGTLLFRLSALAGPIAGAVDAVMSGQPHEVRAAAIEAAILGLGANDVLAAQVVLDALRGESDPPPTAREAEAFLGRCDGPSFAQLLTGVVEVNVEAFRPTGPALASAAVTAILIAVTSIRGRVEGLTSSIRTKPSSSPPTEEAAADDSEG